MLRQILNFERRVKYFPVKILIDVKASRNQLIHREQRFLSLYRRPNQDLTMQAVSSSRAVAMVNIQERKTGITTVSRLHFNVNYEFLL